jgi:energy-coupling factor transport system ATP-binding protein
MKFQLEHIAFSYATRTSPVRRVFSELSLTIRSGEFVLIVGEEGCGKTTLLQLLDGLQRPDAGSVLVDGRNIWESAQQLRSARRRIGFAFQFPEQQFFCETVKDELLYASRNFGLPMHETIASSALGRVGLPSTLLRASPFALSTGEARRVALASLLPSSPDAFLLDEPTAGLDGFGIATVLALLTELSRQGKTIVLVSHQAPVVFHLAHRLLELEGGRVAAAFDLRNAKVSPELLQRFA